MDVLTILLFLHLQYKLGFPESCHVDPTSNRVQNAALNKPASQISTYSGKGTASKAVDGDRNPVYFEGSCMHARLQTGQPYQWWMVDLENEYRIDSVNITNRLRYSGRLRDFDIFVSLNNTFEDDDHMTDNSLCIHVSGGMGSGETRTFTCQTPVFGQFVQIYMETPELRNLHMCEVTIEGYQAICFDEITTEITTESTTLDVSSAATSTPAKTASVATPETTSVAIPATTSAISTTTSETTINATALRKSTSPMSTSSTSTTTVRNQTVIAASLPSNITTTATPACQCPCGVVQSNHTNLTQEAQVELIKELRKELEVNKKETSISKRKLISAGDERQSAETIGFIGVLALCVPILLIVSFDLINLWSFAMQKRNRVIPK